VKRKSQIEIYNTAENIAKHNIATLSKQAPQTLYLAARIAKKTLQRAGDKKI